MLPVRTAFTATALALAASVSANAQEATDLPVGALVHPKGERLNVDPARRYDVIGSLLAGDNARLILRVEGDAHVDTLPFYSMSRLDLSAGLLPRGQMIAAGGLAGAAVGAAVALFAKAANVQQADPGTTNSSAAAKRTAERSIPILAAVGILIGATFDREQWVRVGVPGALHPDPH